MNPRLVKLDAYTSTDTHIHISYIQTHTTYYRCIQDTSTHAYIYTTYIHTETNRCTHTTRIDTHACCLLKLWSQAIHTENTS